jgi:hypothetical protein
MFPFTLVPLAALFLSLTCTSAAAQTPVVAKDGRVELTDPAGDVQPITYMEGTAGKEKEVKYPGYDVVKLAISSDGKTLTFAATLTAPPKNASNEILEFHIDSDNNAKTGIKHPDAATLAGMEFYGTLENCIEHPTFGTQCAGTESRPVEHSAIVTLEKYGREWMFKDTLLSFPAAGKVAAPPKTPIKGPVVQATVSYAAMGVKSGQTIRLVVREYCAGKVKEVTQGFFPEIVLTLK